MTIATAYLMLVPRDESFVPTPGTARAVATRLHSESAFFLSELTENSPAPPPELADDEATRFRLHPHEPHVSIARFHDGFTAFSIAVEEFSMPTEVVNDVSLRYCGTC